jgi:hypothetical protein
MKTAEIKSVLIRKKFPPHTITDEIKKIKKSAQEIAQDSGVPVDRITQMILENIKYVGTPSRP